MLVMNQNFSVAMNRMNDLCLGLVQQRQAQIAAPMLIAPPENHPRALTGLECKIFSPILPVQSVVDPEYHNINMTMTSPKSCYYCGKDGHFAWDCQTGPGSGQPQERGRGGLWGSHGTGGRGDRGGRGGARGTLPPGRRGGTGASAQFAQVTLKEGDKKEKKVEENMTKAAMGQPEECPLAEPRVPVNNTVVDCQPDTWVVKVGGQLYVVGFL